MDNDTIYTIPSANADKLFSEIAKLNKRCAKMGLPLITIKEIGEEIVTPADGRQYVAYHLEITGESPMINGWQLLAILDHVGDTAVIRCLPSVDSSDDLNMYRVSRSCEHCKHKRARLYTAILKSENGVLKQVGKSCLKDFTGHKSIEGLASIAECLSKAIEDAEEYDPDAERGGARTRTSLKEYLSWVAASIRLYGFSGTSAEEEWKVSTKTDAIVNMYHPEPAYRPSEEDREKVEQALTWIREYQGEMNDYMRNLFAVCGDESVSSISTKHMGIAASLINAYNRSMMEARQKAEKKVSQWQGDIKQKITAQVVVRKMLTFDGYYSGLSYLYLMEDQEGNVFTWSTSNNKMSEGDTVSIMGAIKDHSTYNGVKQTVLTRCKTEVLQ